MFVKVHKSNKNSSSNNKGSSGQVVAYLSKENEDKEYKDFEHFFNNDNDKISETEAQKLLDENNKNLSKKDSKFFMLTINPTEREVQHIFKTLNIKEVVNTSELKGEDKEKFELALKSYTKNVMDIYARNFNRNLRGDDLVYVAKIEHKRSYKSFAKEVKENEKITAQIKNKVVERIRAERGVKGYKLNRIQKEIDILKSQYNTIDNKPYDFKKDNLIKRDSEKKGINTHVHVVVHRNTKDYVKISPHATSRGHSQKNPNGGKEQKIGFNHEDFKEYSIEMFNEQFNYKPLEKEVYSKSSAFNKSLINTNKISKRITGKIKNEIKKEVFDSELNKVIGKANQMKEAIVLMASITNPKVLLSKLSKKVLNKVKNEISRNL